MLLGALLNGSASIFLKYAAMQKTTSVEPSYASVVYLMTAMTCYIGAFGLYYLALKQIDVGLAYLVMTATAAVIVNMYGYFVFGSIFSSQNWLGAALVLIGLLLVSR